MGDFDTKSTHFIAPLSVHYRNKTYVIVDACNHVVARVNGNGSSQYHNSLWVAEILTRALEGKLSFMKKV